VVSKEDSMLRLLSRLLPAHVMHELGGGRAIDNARHEHDEVARTVAIVDALVGRLAPVAAAEPARRVEAA
jgi:hypothetical protein